MTSSPALVAYCRAGFEPEAAADLRRIAATAATDIAIAAAPDSGYVLGTVTDANGVAAALAQADPIFTRAVFLAHGPIALVPEATVLPPAARAAPSRVDRVTPLLVGIAACCAPPWRSLWIEFPDTNDGKALSPLSRALAPRVEGVLRERGELVANARQRLRIFLPDGATAWIGTSLAFDGDWPMGIPRLRMPGAAPSRSTQKLAEAFATFLGERESSLVRPGLHAVDLGAAPGGWTWQLVQRGVRVTAVDNGSLKGVVAHDDLVTHVREDAFRFRPRRPVDWLVCDVVESPLRIAGLVAAWIAERRARRAIFNLKLPMKKRYDEVLRCLQHIDEVTRAAGMRTSIRVRQLYHDREEVTGYVARVE